MDLNEKLDILLITYNRAKPLDLTLQNLLAENSPIKDFDITIVDNDSSDNTAEIVKKHQQSHPHLHYEKNKYNIGGNANILKAFYSANKEYVWILADNDEYDWTGWSEVEKFIQEGKDAIFVANYSSPEVDVVKMIYQATFLPGVIYKTTNIDNDVMVNMSYNICNLFPHLALFTKILNENLEIAIVKNGIVKNGVNDDHNKGTPFVRGNKSENMHPMMCSRSWDSGFANTAWMIKDKKLRDYVVTHIVDVQPFNSAAVFLRNKSVYNKFCIFNVLPFFNKIRFLINLLLFYTVFRIVYIYTDYRRDKEVYRRYHKRCRMLLFSCINFKLFEWKVDYKG